VFSKIEGLGATLKPSANSMSVLTLKGGANLQAGDYLLVRDLLIDGAAKTGITGIDGDMTGGNLASLILENVYAMSCDTYGFNLRFSQFVRTHNLKACLGNGVGMLISNDTVNGGGNSQDHSGTHLVQKEVGVVVNGTRFAGGIHSINFYNPQVLSNTVCGMAFFDTNATIYGGAPELNASGAATKVVDGQTVKRSSVHCNNSTIRLSNVQIAEATCNPCVIAENHTVLVLNNVEGYGLTSGVFVQADATSTVHMEGLFGAMGVTQNVVSWPNSWVLPASAQVIMYGEPVTREDPTLPVLYSETAPNITASGANPPAASFVEDTDLGYCRQLVYTAFAGSTGQNFGQLAIGTGAGSQDSVFSVLVKSSTDTQLSINFHNGAAFNDINTSEVYLKAGKVTRILTGKRNIAAGAWTLYWWPVGTDAPTVKFGRCQAYQGPTGTAVTTAELAKIAKHGSFNPGPTRATAANLALKANAVNVSGKYPGKQVWDTTNNRVVFAAGRLDTDVWKDGVNTTVYTPV
jgi:hypothetical protein